MKKCTLSAWTLVAAIMATGAATASAQNAGAVNALESSQQRRQIDEAYKDGEKIEDLYAGESSDVGPQILLKRKARATHFSAMLDSQFLGTSNLLYEDSGTERTTVFVNTAQIAYAPEPYKVGEGTLAPRIGYRHQWFTHGLFDERNDVKQFDFNVQTVFVDGQYRFFENWVLDAGIDWTRLLGYKDYDEFYKEIGPRLGIRRLWKLDDKWDASLGIRTHYRITDSEVSLDRDDLDRWDHVLIGTLSYQIAENLYWQPYYRFQYSDFQDSDRKDCLHTFGCGIHYYFAKNWAVRAFASYDVRRTDNSTLDDYNKWDAGLGINVTFRF